MTPTSMMKILAAVFSLEQLREDGSLAHLRDDIAKLSTALTTKPDGSVYTQAEMLEHLAQARANFQEAERG